MYRNGLIREIRLTLKITASQPGKQTIVVRILPNILRSKGNRAMTFGQRETFFLKNHTQNVVEKLFPDPFLKN